MTNESQTEPPIQESVIAIATNQQPLLLHLQPEEVKPILSRSHVTVHSFNDHHMMEGIDHMIQEQVHSPGHMTELETVRRRHEELIATCDDLELRSNQLEGGLCKWYCILLLLY